MFNPGKTSPRNWSSVFGALLVGVIFVVACEDPPPAKPPPAEYGTSCTENTECYEDVCVALGNGQSACSRSCSVTTECLAGWTCDPGVNACTCSPKPETCNGKDDDCNGVRDDLGDAGPACPSTEGCFDYGPFDGLSPVVAFKADVLPIFRTSCGLSAACHGSEQGPPDQPFLGPPPVDPPPSAAQIDAIFMQIVGVTSKHAATMKRIEPGKPEMSFLMHKMDGTLTCAYVSCEMGCGNSMPLGTIPLPQMDRDVVRRWIAQGAKND